MTTNLHDKMLAAIDALFSASDAVEEEVAENLLLDVRDAINKHKLAADSITEGLRLDDWPKIGCVNHDCDKCKAQQEPDETLLSFYQATDFPSLVSAMEGHIKKMQSKLQSNPHTAIDAWNNRELVGVYCKAWEQSFTADNPYHTVSMTAEDRKHIEAGLKAALAEQPAQQEPWAWLFQHEETGLTQCVDTQQVEWGFEKNNPRWQKIAPLYTTPQPPAQPAREWVGLTRMELIKCGVLPFGVSYELYQAIEAKLKEKNT